MSIVKPGIAPPAPFSVLCGRLSPAARLWRPHPWLAPLSPVYWVFSSLHRIWLRGRAEAGFRPRIPLVVIGALKAGGSGKTSVTLALAKALTARGANVAILVYRLGRGRSGGVNEDDRDSRHGGDNADLLEVFPHGDWRETSDEAVLLRRESGARVFATRNRARAWRRLQENPDGPAFDIILSDDGFQDPRLLGAISLLLIAPSAQARRPGLFDLLPAGPYREPAAARARADLILQGPFPSPASDAEEEETPDERHRFRRRFRMPKPGIAGKWIALAAHGDPGPFLADLRRGGIHPDAVVLGRNHAPLPLSALARLMRRFPGARIACTRKDAIRLEGEAFPMEAVSIAEQAIDLDARTLIFVAERCGLRFG